jgi:hypothetical protein
MHCVAYVPLGLFATARIYMSPEIKGKQDHRSEATGRT